MEASLNLKHTIDQIVKEKGIDRKIVLEALEQAVLTAANKKFRNTRELEVHYNDEVGEVELFEFVTVVEEVQDSYREIDLAEAQEIDPEVEIGDSLGLKMDASGFSRIAAQTAKQVIIQTVREAERETIFNEFKDRMGELINGVVRRFERGDLVVDLGRAEAVLPVDQQAPREVYRTGDRIRALIMDIRMTTKGPQIMLSRSHPTLIAKLFEAEVPEIAEGIVEIKGVVREAGSRSKIAVYSHDHDVDPVGACVGMRGSRVQNVVSELRGEKIDIADDQLSLAIGKRGQNVRLAARLTGWKLDIKSESKAAAAELLEYSTFDGTGDESAEGVAADGEPQADAELSETADSPVAVEVGADGESAEAAVVESVPVESAGDEPAAAERNEGE